MNTLVHQSVTVTADGRLEVLSPELRAGTVTEVIVLLPTAAVPSPAEPTAAERLAALDRLQRRLNLSAADVENWQREVRVQRDGWVLPGDVEP